MNRLVLFLVLLTGSLVLSRHIRTTPAPNETVEEGMSPAEAIRSILNAEAKEEPVDPVDEQEPELAGAQNSQMAIVPPESTQKFEKGWAPTEILWSPSDMSNGYNGNIRRTSNRSFADPERG